MNAVLTKLHPWLSRHFLCWAENRRHSTRQRGNWDKLTFLKLHGSPIE
jgi:hypothetical protein